MPTITDDRDHLWILLVEREVKDGADLRLFHTEDTAAEAARRYLRSVWPDDSRNMPADVHDAIEQYNQTHAYGEEHLLLSRWVVEDR